MDKAERIDRILPALWDIFSKCCACGHHCGVDRTANKTGFCRTSSQDFHHVRCASHTLHFGEEPPLVATGGSGTIFFAHCNLRCVFCQNYQISHEGMGEDMHFSRLADIMLSLQGQGAENINLVTPTHYIYPICEALRDAFARGLTLPVVYNTNGYESIELLTLLQDIVDIYLPDMKYMETQPGLLYSRAQDYPSVARMAIKEMYRQVGPLQVENGVARRGLIVRHLILPNNLSNTYDFLLWMQDQQMTGATVGLMSQYSPQYKAIGFPDLNTRLDMEEYRRIVEFALDLGFENLLTQGLESTETYLPDFRRDSPFSSEA